MNVATRSHFIFLREVIIDLYVLNIFFTSLLLANTYLHIEFVVTALRYTKCMNRIMKKLSCIKIEKKYI